MNFAFLLSTELEQTKERKDTSYALNVHGLGANQIRVELVPLHGQTNGLDATWLMGRHPASHQHCRVGLGVLRGLVCQWAPKQPSLGQIKLQTNAMQAVAVRCTALSD